MLGNAKSIKIAVVGGGAAGVCAALQLAMRGHSVTLYDRSTALMNETSRKTPGRMTSGFHYAHNETAIICLQAIIALIKKYPGFRRGEEQGHELPEDHPMRRGRYFILKETNVPKEEILATYAELEAEYQRLILADPANKVFGDHLYHTLKKEEYQQDVDIDQVDIGIETREHLLNFENFRKFLIDQLKKHGVQIALNHTWQGGHLDNAGRYHLVFKEGDNDIRTEQTDFVINATWANIAKNNQQAGFAMVVSDDAKTLFNPRVNRLKVLAKIILPDELKGKNHMFFCMGPLGCMFSNNGDGTGFITCAEITNMAISTGLEMSEIGFKRPSVACTLEDFLNRREKFQEKDEVVIMYNGREITVKAGDIYRAKRINDSGIQLIYRFTDPDKVYEVVNLPLSQEIGVQQGVSIQDVLAGKLTEEEQQLIGQQMIEGVAKRIPAMQKAILQEVRFGIVQTEGDYQLEDAMSDHNKRNYYGIREEALGWLDTAGIKLMFTPFAAEMVADLVEKQLQIREAIFIALNKHIESWSATKKEIFFSSVWARTTYKDYEDEKLRYEKAHEGQEFLPEKFAQRLVNTVNKSFYHGKFGKLSMFGVQTSPCSRSSLLKEKITEVPCNKTT